MTLEMIEMWHKRARPTPDDAAFQVQLGCHFEEIDELLASLDSDRPEVRNNISTCRLMLARIAGALKANEADIFIDDRIEFADAMADQIVTAVGAMYCAMMPASAVVAEIARSNWSKFDENGNPYTDGNGKIKKGPRYSPPDLASLKGVK